MYRAVSHIVIGVFALVAFLSGCGGGGTTGSSDFLTIAFLNRWTETGDYKTHIIIPEAGHDFYMEPNDFKVIKVTPREGASTVKVTIKHKAGRPDLADTVKEVEVAGEQTVTITNHFDIEIIDGITEPPSR